MEYRSVIILVTIINACHEIDAYLNGIPRDTEVKINDTTYMNCSTSLQANLVQWRHGNNYVYTGIAILEPYDKRFSVEINTSTGACNLVIRSVQPSDAGIYECADDEGSGDRRSVQLIILDDDPVCKSNMHSDGVIGLNSCGIEPEEVKLSCSIKYHGNTLPVLQWKAADGNQSITDGRFNVASINNEVTYTLTLKSTMALNNSSFVCLATRTSDKTYSCSSDAINILYVFSSELTINMTMNDEVNCFANTSQSCTYKWKWFSGDDISTESVNQTLKPKKVGWHRCEATCSFGNKSCTVQSTHAEVYSDSISKGYSAAATNGKNESLLLVLFLVPALGVVAVIIYCYRKRKIKELNRLALEKQKREQGERRLLEQKQVQEEQVLLEVAKRQLDEIEPNEEEERQQRSLENVERELAALSEQKRKLEREDQLLSEANELKMQLEKLERRKAASDKKVKQLVERNHELGRILYLPPKDPIEYKVEPHETIKILASQGPKNLGVCGVAVLDKELFVIRDLHPEVEVYDMSTMKHSRNIQLDGVIDPGDIVACNQNKRIYIVDWTDRYLESKMLRLDTTGKEDIKRLSLTDDECRLSVTRDCNVLVTFYRSRKIIEYTPDWIVVFQTKIKDASIRPIHSVKLSNGHLAICHGMTKESTHRVCIVDDDGSLLLSFGGRKGVGVGQVNFPTYLAVDRSDNILVTDRDNGRVLVLNSRLELTAELLAKIDKLRLPRALLLDETNSRLIVADCNDEFSDGQVLIFNLNRNMLPMCIE